MNEETPRSVWDMALHIRSLAGKTAKANRGRKSLAYMEAREELVDLIGEKETGKLLTEAFQKTSHEVGGPR